MSYYTKKAMKWRLSSRIEKKISPYIYLLPTIILMVGLMIIPMYLVISYSFMDNVIVNKNPVYVGFSNYIKLLTDKVFHKVLANTAYFCITSVVFHFFVGMSFALLLNAKCISASTRSIFRIVYMLPWVFTATIVALVWRLLLNPHGIINHILLDLNVISTRIEWLGSVKTALHAITFFYIWEGYPVYMVSLYAGLQGIPIDLYEAAKIDGASGGQQFLYVTIPMLKPIIISIALLDFIMAMQVHAQIWMTTGGGPLNASEMLSTYTYKTAFSGYQYSQASASAIIMLVVSLIGAVIYIWNQKARD